MMFWLDSIKSLVVARTKGKSMGLRLVAACGSSIRATL